MKGSDAMKPAGELVREGRLERKNLIGAHDLIGSGPREDGSKIEA